MSAIATTATSALKAQIKATWMAGDFGQVAKLTQPIADAFIERRNLQPGTRVLDVACGTGNFAVPAAKAGARVTGLDIATNLIEAARARARQEGLRDGMDVTFEEGDAEELPYADQSFDTVVSMFGAMFAPRPERAAAELIRVCRRGGQIAMANWMPSGFIAEQHRVIARHSPVPARAPAPTEWGDEVKVRERLGAGVTDLRMTSMTASLRYPFPVAETVEFIRTYFGPIQRTFASLDKEGQAALRRDLEGFYARHNRASDGTTHVEAEFLEVVGTRAP